MIELLKESEGRAVGFRVTGRVTADEVAAFEPQIERAIEHGGKKPIGILADLSAMDGADWGARWEEIRFLSRWAEHIARVAVVGAKKWEEIRAEVLGGTVLVQAAKPQRMTSGITPCHHLPLHLKSPCIRGLAGSETERKQTLAGLSNPK